MQVQAYLAFGGRCDEAIAFYKQALGAQVEMVMRFKDYPEPKPPQMKPEFDDKVMHAALRVGDTVIMASDGMCDGSSSFQGFSLALGVSGKDEAEKRFNALASEGGEVRMPLTQTFFSPAFGMVADKFGVSWMVMVNPG